MNKIDEQICEDTANYWLHLGGDADGFDWCWGRVSELLHEAESAQPGRANDEDIQE